MGNAPHETGRYASDVITAGVAFAPQPLAGQEKDSRRISMGIISERGVTDKFQQRYYHSFLSYEYRVCGIFSSKRLSVDIDVGR
ncbi:MAG: hypothetical protein OHK0029_31040 [Armatimonadaceae bacterium]